MGLSMSFFTFPKRKPINVVMLGLDYAGKTTILYQLNLGEVIHKIPNIAFHIATINTESIALASWDIHPYRIKAFWDPYFSQAQGVIFVIDLSDSDAFSEALEELKKLFDDENLQESVFLIFANKMDVAVIKIEEIGEKLQIYKVKQLYHVQVSCVTTGEGLKQGMAWLSNTIQKKGH